MRAARTKWTEATVAEVERTEHWVRLRLEVADPAPYLPGAHFALRLRAEDGYTAMRSYSAASDPADGLLELLVELLPDGEVSGFLHAEARVGDVFELRGPIGGHFTWDGSTPAIAVGGGSGVVPLVSMLRHAQRRGLTDRLAVVAVGRGVERLPYARELIEAGAFVALTRENLGDRVAAPPYPDEVKPLAAEAEVAYVCGSVGFASYATRLLQEVGLPGAAIRVEQFGVTS